MNNRELSRREQFMYYDAEAKFRYEGIKPSGIRGKELPIKLVLELVWRSEAVYWLYPEQEMTEAQLLYIAKEEFAGIPEEEYRPKEGQISYGSLRERLYRELEEYRIPGIGDKNEVRMYPFYRPALERETALRQDVWEAKLSCRGSRDYEVKINADNGVLLEWHARPEGWFDRDREPQPFDGGAENRRKYTAKQTFEAAKTYLQEIGYARASTVYQVLEKVQKASAQNPAGQAVRAASDSENIEILVSLEDLSVSGFSRKETAAGIY